MRNFCFLLFLSAFAATGHAQYGGPRLFLDIPNIFFSAPDVERIGNNLGLGAETAFNVGTHWSVARIGGGATFTMDPQSNELQESFATVPYVLLEIGAGKYRSNGNKCARTKANAFTAMAKAGLRYAFYTGDLRTADAPLGKLDYTVGGEFGYFFIRDIFKNYEVFLQSNYHINAKVISAGFGFKMFLNLRADRD